MITRPFGGGRRDDGHRHVVARRHREGVAAPGRKGVAPRVAGDAERLLDSCVVRLQLGVLDGPILDVRAVDRPPLTSQSKILLTEPGELGVCVDPAATDRRREVVDLAGEDPVSVSRGAAVGARLEDWVGAEQMAPRERDLVVGKMPQRFVRRLRIDEVVAAFLQDDHRPSRRAQHLGCGRPPGSGPDHDHVAVGGADHRPSRAGGKMGSGKPIRSQPRLSRLPP